MCLWCDLLHDISPADLLSCVVCDYTNTVETIRAMSLTHDASLIQSISLAFTRWHIFNAMVCNIKTCVSSRRVKHCQLWLIWLWRLSWQITGEILSTTTTANSKSGHVVWSLYYSSYHTCLRLISPKFKEESILKLLQVLWYFVDFEGPCRQKWQCFHC